MDGLLALGAAKAYTDIKVGEASGMLVVDKLSEVATPVETCLYKVRADYTEGGVEYKAGIYSYNSSTATYSFVSGEQFLDWTDELKEVEWNVANGDWADTHQVKCTEINGQFFIYGKFVLKNKIIDISERHKVLELPFSFAKKLNPQITIKAYKGAYKTWKEAHDAYYLSTGELYINPDIYKTKKYTIKNLTIDADNYCACEIDDKGDEVYLNDWTSTVRPKLAYTEKQIDATQDYEVNRVTRPYTKRSQWVQVDEDKFEIDSEHGVITYTSGNINYEYHGGKIADRPTSMNRGDFYYATDEGKLYRYVQNLYKTYKWTTKTNADYLYHIAIVNDMMKNLNPFYYIDNKDTDNVEGKCGDLATTEVFDLDYNLDTTSSIGGYDGTYTFSPQAQYGAETGCIAEVEGNSLYVKGTCEYIILGGSL